MMTTDDQNESRNNQVHKARFKDWTLMFIFSVITMGSSADVSGNSTSGRTSYEHFAVFLSTISFLVSCLSVFLYLSSSFSKHFVNSVWEGFCAFLLIIIWVIGVSIVSDSETELAVDEDGRVRVGNLYYFAWASLFWSTAIMANFTQSAVGIDVMAELRSSGKRMTIWTVLFALSVVIFANSAHVYDTACTGDDPDEEGFFCTSAGYGIGSGVLCSLLTGNVVLTKIRGVSYLFQTEFILAGIVFLLYTFGVSILTSHSGAGAPLGNLYYGSWASFIISSLCVKSCWEDYQRGTTGSGNNAATNEHANTPGGNSNNDVPEVKANNQYGGDTI